MKQAKFSSEGKDYVMAYDCPDEEINDQINEIFSDKDYELAKRKKDMVVLDIGANVGMFSLFIKDWAKKIYAVEPSKRCFDALAENTKDWDNIEIFNVGLFNVKGRQPIFNVSMDSPPQTMFRQGPNQEMVDIITIEEFFKENKIEHIDVMKIDVEGAEYVIFVDNSFKNVADKIDFIIGESHYINELLPDHVLKLLENAGFKAKLLSIKNQYLFLNYENTYTGQRDKIEIRKPTLFIGEK